MKKKLALFLAAAMTVGAIPKAAFASTENAVSKIASVETDKEFNSSIVIDEFKGIISGDEKQTVKLTLTNAEYTDEQFEGSIIDKEDAQDDVDEAQVAYDSAEEELDNAQSAYDSAKDEFEALNIDVTAEDVVADTEGTYDEDTKKKAQNYIDTEEKLDTAKSQIKYTKLSDTQMMAEFYADENSTAVLNLYCKATDEGDATVTIEDVTKTILHLQQKFR